MRSLEKSFEDGSSSPLSPALVAKGNSSERKLKKRRQPSVESVDKKPVVKSENQVPEALSPRNKETF